MEATSNLSPNELRKHIFILSTFLDSKQSSPSTHHPDDRTLDVYSDISTLLTIRNDNQPHAQNVNAVMGSVLMGSAATSVEFIVCTENTAIHPKIDSREPRRLRHLAKHRNLISAPRRALEPPLRFASPPKH